MATLPAERRFLKRVWAGAEQGSFGSFSSFALSRQECPMPLGFDPPHPGGMAENSPTFQRWVREFRGAPVPKGRLKPYAIRQPSLRDLSDCGGGFPTLKRWAIVACPSGTMTWPGFVGLLWEQILAALDKNVGAPQRSARPSLPL